MGLNLPDKSILLQEQDKFNKPNIIIKISHSKELSGKSKKILNVFIRELLLLNKEEVLNYTIRTNISKVLKQLNIKNRNDFYKYLEELYDYSLDMITIKKTKEQFITRTRVIGTYTTPLDLIDIEGLSDKLIIEFTPFFVNKVLQYSQQYSKLDLIDMSRLKGTHSITLYENFMRFLGTYNYKEVSLTESELRQLLCLEDKYKEFKRFNDLVIKKSIREINDNTSLTITVEKVKENKLNKFLFQINQEPRINFKRFKAALINMYNQNPFSFKWKKLEYVITKDFDDPKAKSIIVNSNTYKVEKTEKVKEIYEYLFNLYKKDYKLFTYKFFLYKNLNIQDFEITQNHEDYEDCLELYFQFVDFYEDTKMKNIEI